MKTCLHCCSCDITSRWETAAGSCPAHPPPPSASCERHSRWTGVSSKQAELFHVLNRSIFYVKAHLKVHWSISPTLSLLEELFRSYIRGFEWKFMCRKGSWLSGRPGTRRFVFANAPWPYVCSCCQDSSTSPVCLLLLLARQLHGETQLLVKAACHTKMSRQPWICSGVVGEWVTGSRVQRGDGSGLARVGRVVSLSAGEWDGQGLLNRPVRDTTTEVRKK